MFKKKDYIKVRGIGKIKCKPEISLFDMRLICEVGEIIPFNIDAESGKKKYIPEFFELGLWSAVISVLTDYNITDRDIWTDLHQTDLINKLYAYYAEYIDEIEFGYTQRINAIVDGLHAINDESLFNGMAKQLEGVDIADLLTVAQSIAEMDGKEIVKAVADTVIP